MTDYIKKAVELADGWQYFDDENAYVVGPSPLMDEPLDGISQIYLDALAAQLVRQVDALQDRTGHGKANTWPNYSKVMWWNAEGGITLSEAQGPDRTMNTIKAIVDSGVLE